jgi:hypothetical protein
MAGPSFSTAVQRWELSMPFMQFDLEMNRKGFIGHKVFRARPVNIQSANVGKIVLEQLLSQENTKRSPGTGYKRSDFEFTSFSYATDEYGHEAPLDDRQIQMYADLLDAETIHAQRSTNFVLDEYERDAASIAFNTTTFASYSGAVGSAWGPGESDWASSNPIADVVTAREAMILQSGLEPNALILNSFAYWNLINSAAIVDRVKFTETATQEVVAGLVAEALGIKMVLVAGGLTNSSVVPTARSVSRIWSSNYAMLARVAETEDPQEPCIGRTFIWTGDGPGAPGTDEELAVIIEEYREERLRGSVIRARNDRQIVMMYPQAGYLLTGVA